RCPQTRLVWRVARRRSGRWRRASAGAWRASGRWCCACLAASPWSFCRGSLACRSYKLEQWREKADAALDGALKERESDPASGELAAAMQRIGELSMEVELLRARIGRPGPLARRGGRGDGRGDFPDHRRPLWRGPGLPDLGPAALLLLRRSPAASGRRRSDVGLGAPRTQA